MGHLSILKSSIAVFSLMFITCNLPTGTDLDVNDELYVKFTNSSASEFVITDIELRAMGKYNSEEVVPAGDCTKNILSDNQTVPPGTIVFFSLDIPSGHQSKFRLGIKDENGKRIMLHAQPDYSDDQLA